MDTKHKNITRQINSDANSATLHLHRLFAALASWDEPQRMEGQLIHNWDQIFQKDNIPPWEDLEPNLEFLSLIKAYSSPEMKVIEIGCGLGHNALALNRMGINVLATDYSKNAVARLAEMAKKEKNNLKKSSAGYYGASIRFG